MEDTSISVLLLVMVVFVSAFMFSTAIRIVPEYARAVIFRLGRYVGVYGPGIIFVIPVIDKAVVVDLREQTRTLTAQSAITADNVRLTVDLTWSYRISDPAKSVLEAANPDKTLQEVARQAWYSLVESQTFDTIINDRPRLRAAIQRQLEDATATWGIKITGVQLSEIKKGN